MKTLFFILLLLPLWGILPASAQKVTKAEKAAREEQQFHQTLQLIESKQFQTEIDRVYPHGGYDVSRFNPRGCFTVTDSIADGKLPFFGKAYSAPYGEEGGIEFHGVMKDVKIKINQRKKTKYISYHFSVKGKSDVYQIFMDIAPSGNCQINVSSNNRTQISYSGQVRALPEKSAVIP